MSCTQSMLHECFFFASYVPILICVDDVLVVDKEKCVQAFDSGPGSNFCHTSSTRNRYGSVVVDLFLKVDVVAAIERD